MLSRFRQLALLAVATVLLLPTVAMAWANGPNGPDSFGTHDWILYEAIKMAQPSWLDTQTALLATDDPDSQYGEADKPNHFYMQSGTYRGGPQKIDLLFRQITTAYWAGDYETASRSFGVLSHYYSDLCVPFHTMGGISDSALHLQYELEVDRMLNQPDAHPEWVSRWGRSTVTDARARAIDAAASSRATYYSLATHYSLFGYSYMADSITQANLSRAINDLADLLVAIPDGAGITGPVHVSTTVSHRYPSAAGPLTAYAACEGDGGMPAEGVAVQFVWSYPGSTKSFLTYSGSDGIAKCSADLTQLELGKTSSVSATLPYAVQANALTSAKFTPTDVIGYMNTKVSERYPSQDKPVTVETQCLNKTGEPIKGLNVTFAWRHRTQTVTRTGVTNADGIARVTRNIGEARKYYKVKVDASVGAAGVTRTASSYFTPADNIGSIEATMTDHEPLRETAATAITTVKDSDGRAMRGIPVTFEWRFRTCTVTKTAITNASGIARSSKDIGKATRGYVVYVTSRARSAGSTKAASTWLRPR